MVCIAMLLTACAAALIPKERAWYASSFTPDTPIDKAVAKCKYDLALQKGMSAVEEAARYQDWDMQHPFIEVCMAAYGYKWQKRP